MGDSGQKLFFSQEIIDSWCDDEKVRFEDNVLTILADKPSSFKLTHAFRFIKVAGDDPDEHHLVGQIKSRKELEEISADVYLTSCIVGEIPYEVEPGYIAVTEGKGDEKRTSEDLLTEFLLKNLF